MDITISIPENAVPSLMRILDSAQLLINPTTEGEILVIQKFQDILRQNNINPSIALSNKIKIKDVPTDCWVWSGLPKSRIRLIDGED